MDIKSFLDSQFNIRDGVKAVFNKAVFWKQNPDYFSPDGIWIFCGPQGSGKTLSAVRMVLSIHKAYPKAIIVSNLTINGLETIPFEDYSQITSMENGVYGIIFLIDEIHTVWNSLESRNIPVSEMASFAQMRKQRRLIIGTSQVYGRIAKPIREQLKWVILCQNYFGIFQNNIVINPHDGEERDGKLTAKIKFHQRFFHTSTLYNSYDTLYEIKRPERKALKWHS